MGWMLSKSKFSFRKVTSFLAGLVMSTAALAQDAPTVATCPEAAIEQSASPMRPYKSAVLDYSRHKNGIGPKDAEVIILGDSIAELWDEKKLADLIAPKRVLNLGIGGDRTQQVLWRLDQMALEDYDPQAVVLVIGTNNLGDGEPVCGVVAGIEAIVARLAQHWRSARFLFIQIPPRGEDFARYTPERIQVSQMLQDDLGAQIEVLALDRALTCGLDTFPQSYHDAVAQCQKPPVPCTNYRNDFMHLEQPGYDVLNAAVVAALAAGP